MITIEDLLTIFIVISEANKFRMASSGMLRRVALVRTDV
jgi:hypothetical protein